VIIRYSNNVQVCRIVKEIDISKKTVCKIISCLIQKMEIQNRSERKLGGPGIIVQIDETMMNYKCKSHRGRSAGNKSDAICFVECNDIGKIVRCWAQLIADKKASTIIPIVCERVVSGSTIYTDEHPSYRSLVNNGYLHGTVCHKYYFVDPLTGIHTQAIESFHNEMKLKFKNQKGIKTENCCRFLSEFVWFWNHKGSTLSDLFNLIKF
jgi:transposase-like protein